MTIFGFYCGRIKNIFKKRILKNRTAFLPTYPACTYIVQCFLLLVSNIISGYMQNLHSFNRCPIKNIKPIIKTDFLISHFRAMKLLPPKKSILSFMYTCDACIFCWKPILIQRTSYIKAYQKSKERIAPIRYRYMP